MESGRAALGTALNLKSLSRFKFLFEDEVIVVELFVNFSFFEGQGKDIRGELCVQSHVQWSFFPDMRLNTQFALDIAALGVEEKSTVLIMCRSGQRSQAAATALTSLGFEKCYNVATGFEGDRDPANHRGVISGWKADGLPWGQP